MSLPNSIYSRLPKRLPFSRGFSRYSLSFDGINDYLFLGSPAILDDLTVFTWQMWVYANSVDATPRLADKRRKALYFHTGRLRMDVVATTTGISRDADVFPTGRWVNVAVTYDDAGDRLSHLHKNGEEATLGVATAVTGVLTSDAAENLVLAMDYLATGGPLDGILDEVLFYSRILSQDELRYNVLNYHNPITDNLLLRILRLRLEEGTGLVARDTSGYGNDGSLLPVADPPTWRKNAMWELRAEAEL